MVMVSLMPTKVDLAWIRTLVAWGPTVGANYHGSTNISAMEGSLWRFVERGEQGGAIQDGVAQVYPTSDPAAVAKSYILL
jgi:hypothetical protein